VLVNCCVDKQTADYDFEILQKSDAISDYMVLNHVRYQQLSKSRNSHSFDHTFCSAHALGRSDTSSTLQLHTFQNELPDM
jgi:hypothetical protein